MPKTKRKQMRLSMPLHRAVDLEAARRKVEIQELVDAYVEHFIKAYDQGKRLRPSMPSIRREPVANQQASTLRADLHERLPVMSAELGVTIKELFNVAVSEGLERDGVRVPDPAPGTQRTAVTTIPVSRDFLPSGKLDIYMVDRAVMEPGATVVPVPNDLAHSLSLIAAGKGTSLQALAVTVLRAVVDYPVRFLDVIKLAPTDEIEPSAEQLQAAREIYDQAGSVPHPARRDRPRR